MLADHFLNEEDKGVIILHKLINKNLTNVVIMNYGATVLSIDCIDKYGQYGDVLLGFNHIDGYRHVDNPYMNCIIGRFANRIRNSQFTLDGQHYHIANALHGLHGGKSGFDKKLWQIVHADDNTIRLEYISADGEEGFPGTLQCAVTYTLDDNNALHIEYEATVSKACPVNLTNHCYFNLSAGKESNIYNHDLQVSSDQITENDNDQLPTGHFMSVKGTVFDLNMSKNLGPLLYDCHGFDHNWVVGIKSKIPKKVATLSHLTSGRKLIVLTTEPGLQIYTANGLDNRLLNVKYNQYSYGIHAGICLEAQLFPDSPNHPEFPNTILRPNEEYHQHTIYQFGLI